MSDAVIWALREGENIVLSMKEYDATLRRSITRVLCLSNEEARKLADEIKRLA